MNNFALRDEATRNIRNIANVRKQKVSVRKLVDEKLEAARKDTSIFDCDVDFAVPLEVFKYKDCSRNYGAVITSDKKIEFEIPDKPHQFKPMTEELLIETLGRKWKSVLKGFLYFVEYEQFCIPKDKQVSVPIATTSRTLLNYFQKPYNISTFLQRATAVELIWCSNTDYNFWNTLKGEENYSKKYIINREVMSLVKEVCKKYKIEVDLAIKNTVDTADEASILGIPSRIINRIKFGSGLRIPKSLSDSQITAALYYNYPWLKRYQEKADKMNQFLTPENQIKFNITINRSKYFITKLGIRATNRIVSLKEHENENRNYKGIWRKDYLKGYFGGESYFHFDVKSSIYRVQYLLNHGTWLSNDIDLYQEIATRKFRSNFDRETFKHYSMYNFFDTSSASIYNHNIEHLPQSQRSYEDKEIRDYIKRARDKFNQVIGESCRSEIFLHESCIYLDVVEVLRSRGIKVVQIYDSFYTDQEVSDMESIVQEAASNYLWMIREELNG